MMCHCHVWMEFIPFATSCVLHQGASGVAEWCLLILAEALLRKFWVLSRSLYRSHVLTTFFGPVLGPWWSRFVGIRVAPRLSEACPRHEGQSEAHGGLESIYYGVRPMRHRKTACFGALVLEPHFAQSCGRFLLLTWGRFLAAAGFRVPSWWRNLLQVLVRELKPLQAAAQSVATGISTVLLWRADAIRHCFLMLALLRPSRRTRTEQKIGSKAPPAVAKSTPTAAKLGCAFSPQRGAYSWWNLDCYTLKTVEICGKTWPAYSV